MAVTELFPKKHIKETYKLRIPVSAKGQIFIGDIDEQEDDSNRSIYDNVEAIISQYFPEDNQKRINELTIVEYDCKDSFDKYKMILEYDILSKRCGARLLSSILVADDDNYAYINSGSKQSKISFYQYVSPAVRISRIAFDATYVSVEDLRLLVSRVFPDNNIVKY